MWYAIVLAGGSGSRMGAKRNKVLMTLGGQTVIARAIAAFEGLVAGVVLVGRRADFDDLQQAAAPFGDFVTLAQGGETRQESVWRGLCALPDACTHVLIHDGARCLVDAETIRRCMASAEKHGSGVAAIPAVDTIKQADAQGVVTGTPDRAHLMAVQTPQAFPAEIIKRAHLSAQAEGFTGTDDASLVERLGLAVHLTPGSRRNMKLTTPEDMMIAAALIDDLPELRTGMGYDVHRLVEGRELILCGVTVPHTLGLLGHSDADVALHALMDAMLGAAALGDIGRHFPDTDERYRGVSSMTLLRRVAELLAQHGAQVTNCDVTIAAQRPRLLPHIAQMRQNVADALQLPVSRVNVKATTTERLGFEGREEGISAQAVCMVRQRG